MKINKKNALKLWDNCYGNEQYVEDFHGYLMCREGYGNPDYYIYSNGGRIYCGWNIHHILPKAFGGTNAQTNLLYTNIATNEEAGDRIRDLVPVTAGGGRYCYKTACTIWWQAP